MEIGATGDVELELPEGTPDFNPDMNRIRPSAGEPDQDTWVSNSRRTTVEGGLATVPEGALDARASNGSIKLLDNLTAVELAAVQQQQQKGLQVPDLLLHLQLACSADDIAKMWAGLFWQCPTCTQCSVKDVSLKAYWHKAYCMRKLHYECQVIGSSICSEAVHVDIGVVV